jgi:hypothetical protein
MVKNTETNYFYLFGGFGEGKNNSELKEYDAKKKKWETIHSKVLF